MFFWYSLSSLTVLNRDLIAGTVEEAVGETGITDLTQTLKRIITEDGTAVGEDGIMTTPMKTTATGDPTLTRETAGATTTTTMASGAMVGAAVGATMDTVEVKRGQTQTQEVIMAVVRTVEAIMAEVRIVEVVMAEVRTVEAIMAEVRTMEVTGPEAGLVSRLRPPRTRARMLASSWV